MRKTVILGLACLLAASNAMAQAYKCVINGKTVYADAPCAQNAKNVGAPEDHLSDERQLQRLQQSIKERRQRNAIESNQESIYLADQRALAAQANAEAVQGRAKASRCTSMQRELSQNKRSVAFYQDLGMQRSLTRAEQEEKRNYETYDRECR